MPEKTKLLAAAELPVNTQRCIQTPKGAIAVFHTADGFFAVDNRCPHRAGSLSDGLVQDGHVACPLHQWQFDLKTGTCANIPGARISSYVVEQIDGDLWLA